MQKTAIKTVGAVLFVKVCSVNWFIAFCTSALTFKDEEQTALIKDPVRTAQ